MKRRRLLQSMAALPAAAALPLPAPAQAPTPADNIELTVVSVTGAGEPVPRFFSRDQFRALERLADILMPAYNDRPGAKEARAAEFIDFLISSSPIDRQQLYKAGLDRLNAEARSTYDRTFAELEADQFQPILKPMQGDWSYDGPADRFARFLLAAKDDLMRATINSREYAAAASRNSRGYTGTGYYWLPIE